MPFGYAIELGPEGVVKELDSSTCGHCQRVTFLQPQPRGVIIRMARCGMCHAPLCEECYAKLAQGSGCTPWERQMERIEAADRLARAAGV